MRVSPRPTNCDLDFVEVADARATVPGPETVTSTDSDVPTAPASVVLVSDALFIIG